MAQEGISIRQLCGDDGEALRAFYSGLSQASIRTFKPLGPTTTLEACSAVCQANVAGEKYDLVAVNDCGIVGWGFVWDLAKPEPMFGLGVADALHGRGIGPELTRRVLAECDRRRLPRVVLTVVKDNHRARRIYERQGFVTYGELHLDYDGLDYYRMERLLAEDMTISRSPYAGYSADLGTLPFSFVYDEVAYMGFPPQTFQQVEHRHRLEGEKQTHCFVLKAGDLQVTVDTAFYTGYGAYEWTVWFENTGTRNSDIISNLRAGDPARRTREPQRGPISHDPEGESERLQVGGASRWEQ